jgi:tetratricopeptide (TPR) repeat protein
MGLSRILSPQSHVRAFFDKCAVCGDVSTGESRTFCLCANCLKFVETATQRSTVQLEQNLHRPWLIKSVNRIWGPMSTEEVESGLRAKEIAPIDEVTKPLQHWRYIREENDFKMLLDELKTNAHAREDTLSITVIENTANPIAEAIRDVRPLSVEEELGPIKHYDFGDSSRTQPSRVRTYAVAGAVVAAAAFIWALFQWSNSRPLPETDAQIDGVVREVLFSRSQVDRERAIGVLREAHDRNPKNPRLALNLALLHIEQKETIPATRILERLLKTDLPPIHENEVRNALALAFIINGQLAQARDEIEKVIKGDNQNYIANYNLSAVNLLDKDLKHANADIQRALEQKNSSGEAVTMAAEIALREYDKDQNRSVLQEAKKRLERFIENAVDRKQEATIFAATVTFKLGETEEAARLFESLNEIDPELSEDHLHDLMTFKDHLHWEQLLIKCRDLANQLNSTPRVSSALGLCHLKANEPLVGREVIEDSLRRAPDDQVVQAMYGYVQNLVGQKDQAEAALKRAASDANDLQVAMVLRARLCLSSENWDCANQILKRLSEKYPDAIQGKVGLAQLAIENREKTEAQKYLNQAEKISPHYIPLLRLKEVMVLKGVL